MLYVEPPDKETITYAAVEFLKVLTNLKDLDLRETGMTPEGIRELQESLPNCKIAGP
jgi:hypothetical protein